MKKTWWIAGLVLTVGFLAATWLRHAGTQQENSPASQTADRARIQSFWAAYHNATESRIRGDYGQAIEGYRRALEIDPRHEESLYYLGNSLLELGRLEQAEATYLRLTEINPSSQRAFSQLGTVSATLLPGVRVNWEQARQAFQRVVEINREESGPFLRLGTVNLQQGRLEEAERHFETAAGFRSPEGFFLAGVVEFEQERFAKAVRQFSRVLELGAHEVKISGRGLRSEGDVETQLGGPLTPLKSAQIKARVFLFWTAAQMGGYPPEIAADFRLAAPKEGPAARLLRSVGSGSGGARWIDFDVDGDLDLSVAGGHQGSLALYENRAGSLRSLTGIPRGASGSDLAWGDTDRDGDPDLLLIGSDWGVPARPSLYINQGTGSSGPVLERSRAFGLIAGLEHVVRGEFEDLDGDGFQDLALASAGDPSLIFLRNNGRGDFSRDPGLQAPSVEGIATDLKVGDVDGDGRSDILLVRWKQSVLLLVNQGAGRFIDQTQRWGLSNVRAPGFRALLLDYDRDGDQDLLLGGNSPYASVLQALLDPSVTSSPGGPRLFANSGDGRFEEVTSASGLPAATSTMAMAAADLNHDGWPDLVLAEGGPEAQRLLPSLLLMNHEGRFETARYLPSFAQPVNASGVAVAATQGGRPLLFLSGAGLFRPAF